MDPEARIGVEGFVATKPLTNFFMSFGLTTAEVAVITTGTAAAEEERIKCLLHALNLSELLA